MIFLLTKLMCGLSKLKKCRDFCAQIWLILHTFSHVYSDMCICVSVPNNNKDIITFL